MITKKRATTIAVLILLALMTPVLAQANTIEAQAAHLDELDKYLQSVNADLKEKLANFDKTGSTVTTGRENVDGIELNVTTYTDAAGYILKIYKDEQELVLLLKLISPDCGPQLIITYSSDGSVAKEETIECKRCSKLTVTYNSDSTNTVMVQDCNLAANNTLNYQLDGNSDLIPGSRKISTNACVPMPACCSCAPSPVIVTESACCETCCICWNYCETTKQWEEVKKC